MLVGERHRRILEELGANPEISVAQLSKILYVSEPTIRRDLTELQRQGLIRRNHGGAELLQFFLAV